MKVAIEAYGLCCKRLPWSKYQKELKLLLHKLENNSKVQTQFVIKIISA